MKKSLLALAVLGAFAGAASAQTNVTIYGIVDAGIQRTDTNAPGVDPKWELASGLQNGSRLGFKGSEDLGGGLSAIFTLENGFNVDDGTLGQSSATKTRLFGRQAFVGLQGAFGAVKLGRQYTPIHLALDSVDPFHTNLAGNIENVFNAYGIRSDNTINYSLTSGPISGQVAYSLGEDSTGFSKLSQLGLSVGYANGPINAVVAYHQQKNAAGSAKARTTMIGGTYDFGVAKAHAAFADNRDDVAAEKTRDYMLGVSAPVGGAGTVLASWNHKKDRDSSAKFDQLAVGYLHSLSKRTGLYTSLAYGKLKEDGVADAKNNTFNVGIRHSF